jgi:histidinol-phosphate aminotransferase
MSLSRRALFRTLAGGRQKAVPSMITARGLEAMQAEFNYTGVDFSMLEQAGSDRIQISSNENPYGPGPAALRGIEDQLDQSGRYVFNARTSIFDLIGSLANYSGTMPENILTAAGSGEILVSATRAFTSADRALVTGTPSYGQPLGTARAIGAEIKQIPLDSNLKLDLDRMADASKGAGMVFFCNPNNPTATIHSASDVRTFVNQVHKLSPTTVFLLDEAYSDYVTDPAYGRGFDLLSENPRVVVARTFSKAYGMAGLRCGYAAASKQLIDTMRPYTSGLFAANNLVVAGAVAAMKDPAHLKAEVDRNAKVRKFTMDFFAKAGFEATDSQTNFIFVDVKRTAKSFRDACAEHNVLVGRDFPPLEKTHARISIGTEDEMKRAVEVFAEVLGTSTSMSSSGGQQ